MTLGTSCVSTIILTVVILLSLGVMLSCIVGSYLCYQRRNKRKQRKIIAASCDKDEDSESRQNVDTPCSICLEPKPSIRTQCMHKFHYKCLKNWFMNSSECPNCRMPLILVFSYCEVCKQYSSAMRMGLEQRPKCRKCVKIQYTSQISIMELIKHYLLKY